MPALEEGLPDEEVSAEPQDEEPVKEDDEEKAAAEEAEPVKEDDEEKAAAAEEAETVESAVQAGLDDQANEKDVAQQSEAAVGSQAVAEVGIPTHAAQGAMMDGAKEELAESAGTAGEQKPEVVVKTEHVAEADAVENIFSDEEEDVVCLGAVPVNPSWSSDSSSSSRPLSKLCVQEQTTPSKGEILAPTSPPSSKQARQDAAKLLKMQKALEVGGASLLALPSPSKRGAAQVNDAAAALKLKMCRVCQKGHTIMPRNSPYCHAHKESVVRCKDQAEKDGPEAFAAFKETEKFPESLEFRKLILDVERTCPARGRGKPRSKYNFMRLIEEWKAETACIKQSKKDDGLDRLLCVLQHKAAHAAGQNRRFVAGHAGKPKRQERPRGPRR